MPDEGFSPDADFPVIRAEKGILQFRMDFPVRKAPFTALYGGERPNMVCALAAAEGAEFDPARAEKCGVVQEGGKLVARGRAAHASTPDEGENALQKLLAYFAPDDEEIAKAYDVLFKDALGLKKFCDDTGHLTMSPNVAEFKDGKLRITTDIRYPATMKREEVTAVLDTARSPYELLHCQEPLYNDEHCFLISTLRRVYEEKTGRSGAPVAIGGRDLRPAR